MHSQPYCMNWAGMSVTWSAPTQHRVRSLPPIITLLSFCRRGSFSTHAASGQTLGQEKAYFTKILQGVVNPFWLIQKPLLFLKVQNSQPWNNTALSSNTQWFYWCRNATSKAEQQVIISKVKIANYIHTSQVSSWEDITAHIMLKLPREAQRTREQGRRQR